MILKVIQTPNPLLLTKSKHISTIDKKTKKLVADMIDTLERARDPEGVGLAAVQVGVLKQIFIIKPSHNIKF